MASSGYECPVCGGTLRDARLLPCGHAFCVDCLNWAVQARGAAQCPACNVQFSAPAGDVHRLPSPRVPLERFFQQNSLHPPRRGSPERPRPAQSACDCGSKDCWRCGRRDSRVGVARSFSNLTETCSPQTELAELARHTQLRIDELQRVVADRRAMADNLRREGVEQAERIKFQFGQLVHELLLVESHLVAQIQDACTSVSQRVGEAEDTLRNGRLQVSVAANMAQITDLANTVSYKSQLRNGLERIEGLLQTGVAPKVVFQTPYETDLQNLVTSVRAMSQKANDNCYTIAKEVENGLIFAIGGWDGWNRCNLAEVYDAATNEWIRIADMTARRDYPAATCADGKVYVTGGLDGDQTLSSAEVYNPVTNKWSEIGSMHIPRHGHGLAHMDGEIYAVGGSDGSQRLSSVERYNVQSGKWRFIASMNHARGGACCTAFQKEIVVVGGWDGKENLGTCEAYKAETGKWRFLSPLNTKRLRAAIATYRDRMYVFGGWNECNSRLDSIEEYDSKIDKWQVLQQTLKTGRSCFGAASLNNKIYVVGGWSQHGLLNSVECFDPAEQQLFGEVAPISTAREYVAVTFCDVQIDVILRSAENGQT